jgi:simple sugar transport system permease protein
MSLDLLVLFQDSLDLSVVLIIAAMGGLLQMRSGVVNIAIEGQLIIGALAGFVISSRYESYMLGLLAAIVCGAISGAFLCFLILQLRANQILVGLGFNILISGAIGYILKTVLGISGTLSSQSVEQIPRLSPVPDSWPRILRIVFNGHDLLYFVATTSIIGAVVIIRYSRIGLRLQAVGLSDSVSLLVGLKASKIRLGVGVFSGALVGLAGAELSLGQVGLFNLQMVAGRGFIALAAFYFGRTNPFPTAFACLVFAFFDSLQVQLQLMNFSANLVSTLPYLMVVIALILSEFFSRTRKGTSK